MDSLIQLPPPIRIEYPGSWLLRAEFADDGRTVFVHMHTPMLDTFALVAAYFWQIGLGVFVLGALVGAFLLWRVLRRRQRDGAVYCRRCNYDLSDRFVRRGRQWERMPAPTVDDREPCCPECGGRSLPRGLRRGVATWKRCVVPMVIIALSFAAFAWPGVMRLRGQTITRSGMHSPYLSASLAEWTERRQVQWLAPFVVRGDRVLEIDAVTGRTLGTIFAARGRSSIGMRLTPDGGSLVRMRLGSGGSGARVSLIPIRRGGRTGTFRVPLSSTEVGSDGSPIVAFAHDGRTMLVSGFMRREVILVELDLEDGSMRDLYRESWASNPNATRWTADRLLNPSTIVLSTRHMINTFNNNMQFVVYDYNGVLVERVRRSHSISLQTPDAVQSDPPPLVIDGGAWAYFSGHNYPLMVDGQRSHGTAMVRFDLVGDGEPEPIEGLDRYHTNYTLYSNAPSQRLVISPVQCGHVYCLAIYDRFMNRWIATVQLCPDARGKALDLNQDGTRCVSVTNLTVPGGGGMSGRALHLFDFTQALPGNIIPDSAHPSEGTP